MLYKRFYLILIFTTIVKGQTFRNSPFLGFGFNVGMQHSYIQLFIHNTSLGRIATFNTEVGVGVSVKYAFSKFSIHIPQWFFDYESYVLPGFSKHQPDPVYAGDLNYLQEQRISFSGIGFGLKRSYNSKKIALLKNKLGVFYIRNQFNNSFLLTKFQNDFRAYPIFRGAATDQGETGAIYVNYTDDIQKIGFAIELFTPIPDYSKSPTVDLNSKNGEHPVLEVVKNTYNKYHGNFYITYSHNKLQDSEVKIGVDSKIMGAFTQNLLHDNFGLYPRFPWPIKEKDVLFLQLNKSYSNEF